MMCNLLQLASLDILLSSFHHVVTCISTSGMQYFFWLNSIPDRVSHSLELVDCIPVVSLNMLHYPPYFL